VGSPGAGVPAPDAAAVPIVLTATIASPTRDMEAARAKLWVRLREQLAVSAPAAVVHEDDEGALVVTGPRESSDSYGRVWFWFRGTVQVPRAPAAADVGGEPAPWPLRPPPRRNGDGWACHLSTPTHASRVRRGLRTRLQEGTRTGNCTQDAGDDLMLAFEELTSNAFRHGAGAVRVTIADTAAGWLLVVEDEAPDRPPLPAAGRDHVLGGLGLGMVAGLALDVGWQPHAGRKSVWAELPSHR
jgi:anti-sigma regulatory factor (Ser/Thr protein kinase)